MNVPASFGPGVAKGGIIGLAARSLGSDSPKSLAWPIPYIYVFYAARAGVGASEGRWEY